MYANELLNAYKKAQNYVQDKQIAHDLNLTPQKISNIRKGIRYVSDDEAIILAEGAGIDKELALLGCHADRNDNPNTRAVWESIAKKWNSQGLQLLGVGLVALNVGFVAVTELLSQCALYILC